MNRLAIAGSGGRAGVGGARQPGEENEDDDDNDDGNDEDDVDAITMSPLAEDVPLHVETALMRRRRRVCSCSSQTDVQQVSHPYSPTPGTSSPTASQLGGFSALGR